MSCQELAMELVWYLLQLTLISENTGSFSSLRNFWKDMSSGVASACCIVATFNAFNYRLGILIVLHIFSWKINLFLF